MTEAKRHRETKKLKNEEESVEIKTCEMPDWKFFFDSITWDNREFKRTPKLLFAHQVWLQYCRQSTTQGSLSMETFIDFAKTEQQRKKVQSGFIPAEVLQEVWNYRGKDLSPVAAIVGGIVAQEIIKVLSGKDEPLGNTFVFDGHQSRGMIEKLMPQQTSVSSSSNPKISVETIEL